MIRLLGTIAITIPRFSAYCYRCCRLYVCLSH